MTANGENSRTYALSTDNSAMDHAAFICPNCHFGPSEVTALSLSSSPSKSDDDIRQARRHPNLSTCTCLLSAEHALIVGGQPNIHFVAMERPLLLEVEEMADGTIFFSRLKEESAEKKDDDPSKLTFIFVMFVISGSANVVFGKLSAVPMYNYPNFFNMWICFLFVILCYAYIVPAVYVFDAIPREQFKLSKRPFAIMGIFDCLSGLMSSFAAVYLPGPLLVLLPQAAIPFSMCFSVLFLNCKYSWWHYMGAMTVIMGIVIVLEPLFTSRHSPDFVCVANAQYMEEFCFACEQQSTIDDCKLQHVQDVSTSSIHPFFSKTKEATMDERSACRWLSSKEANLNTSIQVFWSFVLILANIPKVLSGIYKERYSEKHEVDSVYINAWIAIFQTVYSIFLAVPAGYLTSPPVPMAMLPQNFLGGLKCYFGIGSILTGCHPDRYCELWGPMFSNVFLLVNCVYSIFAILILKHGSANLMFLALTLMVPISNLAFAMPHMPQRSVIHATDLIGLITIMSGLVFYRFGSSVSLVLHQNVKKHSIIIDDDELTQSLLLYEQADGRDSIPRIERGDI